MPGTVAVGGEPAAFGRELADGRQGEDLEAAAVRQDGPVPMFEFVQSAGLSERVQAGTEIEMIGVPEDDLRLDVLLQVPVIHALDGTDGSDGHEDGGMDLAVVGRDHARAGGGLGILGSAFKLKHLFSFQPSKLRKFSYICTMLKQ